MTTKTIGKFNYSLTPLSDAERGFVITELARIPAIESLIAKSPKDRNLEECGRVILQAHLQNALGVLPQEFRSVADVFRRHSHVQRVGDRAPPERMTSRHFERATFDTFLAWILSCVGASFGNMDRAVEWLAVHQAKGDA